MTAAPAPTTQQKVWLWARPALLAFGVSVVLIFAVTRDIGAPGRSRRRH